MVDVTAGHFCCIGFFIGKTVLPGTVVQSLQNISFVLFSLFFNLLQCPGFSWGGVNFPPSSYCSAVFGI